MSDNVWSSWERHNDFNMSIKEKKVQPKLEIYKLPGKKLQVLGDATMVLEAVKAYASQGYGVIETGRAVLDVEVTTYAILSK
jgi:hypothetical protein